jgi:GNAT superfamily N-acetyltransferase
MASLVLETREDRFVPRVPVLVRQATVDDVGELSPLWAEFQELSGPTHGAPSPHDIGERVRERIATSAAIVAAGGRPTYRLVIATIDGVAVGFASLSVLDHGLLTAASAVLVDVVHVVGTHRKAGVGTSLLREAVGLADEVGATDVVVNVPPSMRDVNRFYARHGFSPMVLRRSAPVAQLRRRLGVEPRLDARDATGDLSTVQRALRRRALLTPRRSSVR